MKRSLIRVLSLVSLLGVPVGLLAQTTTTTKMKTKKKRMAKKHHKTMHHHATTTAPAMKPTPASK